MSLSYSIRILSYPPDIPQLFLIYPQWQEGFWTEITCVSQPEFFLLFFWRQDGGVHRTKHLRRKDNQSSSYSDPKNRLCGVADQWLRTRRWTLLSNKGFPAPIRWFSFKRPVTFSSRTSLYSVAVYLVVKKMSWVIWTNCIQCMYC